VYACDIFTALKEAGVDRMRFGQNIWLNPGFGLVAAVADAELGSLVQVLNQAGIPLVITSWDLSDLIQRMNPVPNLWIAVLPKPPPGLPFVPAFRRDSSI
jgi:hypothetical protein